MSSYRLFMEEFIRLAMIEENGFDDELFEEDGRPGVYKESYYLRDNMQNRYVKPVLAKTKTQEFLIDFVGKFLDAHSNQLSTSGPIHMFTFGEKEMQPIYDLFGLNPSIIMDLYYKMIDEAFYGKISVLITGLVKNAPHKMLLTCILIDAIQNKYDDIVTCCEYLWAFAEYPLLYRKFWQTGVKEDVMNYTIEHLGSKFKVKKYKNIQGLLLHDTHSSVVKMGPRLETGADNTYTDFVQRVRNQMKATFRNIANAYYDNDEENASLHNKSSQFDDGSMADQEGHGTNIAQVVDATVSKFATGGVNGSIARVAANGSQVDKDTLIGYINQINATKDNKISKLVENVITAFFNKNPTNTSIGSTEFLNFGLALYRSIGTSKDPMYQEIKAILNFWIHDIVNIKQYYQREGTWINYTRAIFNYTILMINYYN